MTHRPVKVLSDGTRVYADYHRYKPKPAEDRVYGVNKPEDPRAVRFHGRWFLPLDVLADGDRVMPETRPDTDAYEHMDRRGACGCAVCSRPQAERWRSKWRRERGLQS